MPEAEARFYAEPNRAATRPGRKPVTCRSRSRSPIVSVVLPARDAESTITETVESVLTQTLRELELIVVDDGSVDGTVACVQGAADRRVRIVSTEKRGLGAARNTGLEGALGEFVAFIDADDVWSRDKLETHVDALRRRPDAAFCYSWTVFVDGAGRYLFAKKPEHVEGEVGDALLREYFLASGSNLFVRRDVALAVGGFDEQLGAAQDWDFALKLAPRGRLLLVPRYQVFYRIAEGSLSSNAELSAVDCSTVTQRAAQRETPAVGALRASQRKIRAYQCFLLLTRSGERDFDRRARRLLVDSVREDPRWMLSTDWWALTLTSFICRFIPRRLRRRSVLCLLRVHGAWLWLRHVELRRDLRKWSLGSPPGEEPDGLSVDLTSCRRRTVTPRRV